MFVFLVTHFDPCSRVQGPPGPLSPRNTIQTLERSCKGLETSNQSFVAFVNDCPSPIRWDIMNAVGACFLGPLAELYEQCRSHWRKAQWSEDWGTLPFDFPWSKVKWALIQSNILYYKIVCCILQCNLQISNFTAIVYNHILVAENIEECAGA